MAVLWDDAGDSGFICSARKRLILCLSIADVSLGEAVLLIAQLGGYLKRKNDADPGHQVV